MMIALDEPATIDDTIFDSPEEMWLSWWLEELKDAGYVRDWRRAPTYVLSPAITVPYLMRRNSKRTGEPLKPEERKVTLRSQLKYTPDFEVDWSIKAFGLLYVEFDPPPYMDGPIDHHLVAHLLERKAVSTIEVKPRIAGRNAMNTGRLSIARMNTMILLEQKGVYANLVEIGTNSGSLFEKTFTPERFKLTDKTLKERALKFSPRSLDEFVEKTTKLKVIPKSE